ncbi:MAG: XisI protein [Planctomycetes bacterium]|nr:XisI protein [Planctomycetota bacterium]
MDSVRDYPTLLKGIISEIAEVIQQQRDPASSSVETQCAFDDARGQYLLTNVGWRSKQRVRGITLHVRLKNGKFWIEEDMTEDGVANRLLESGVPKEDIVLAFQPPDVRPHTEFAVA